MFELYAHIDELLLIFCRIFFALFFLPIMTETKLPGLAKGGLTLILTLIVYSVIPPIQLHYAGAVVSYFILVIKEILVGLIIGFGVMLFFQVYYFVGNLLSTQGGLGMSMVFDPVNGTQIPILGKLYYLMFAAIFIISGGYHWFIKSLAESFFVFAPGQAVINANILYDVVRGISVFWEIGFKIASPIIAVLFIVDCGLGILARTVPQMNMFVIGLPLKLILMLILLIATIGLLPTFNQMIIKYIVDFVELLIQGMRAR